MMHRTCPFCDDLSPADAEFCETCHQRIVVYSTLAYFNGNELRQPRFAPRLKTA